MKVIEAVMAEWEELAIALHFDSSVIEAVRRDTFYQTSDACRQILCKWLEGEGQGPVNWSTLLDSLLRASFVNVAVDLKEALQQQDYY